MPGVACVAGLFPCDNGQGTFAQGLGCHPCRTPCCVSNGRGCCVAGLFCFNNNKQGTAQVLGRLAAVHIAHAVVCQTDVVGHPAAEGGTVGLCLVLAGLCCGSVLAVWLYCMLGCTACSAMVAWDSHSLLDSAGSGLQPGQTVACDAVYIMCVCQLGCVPTDSVTESQCTSCYTEAN